MKYKIGLLLCVVTLIFSLVACREKTNVTGQDAIGETKTEGQAGAGETSAAETGETEFTEPEATKPGDESEKSQEGSDGVKLGVTTRPPIPGTQGEPGSDVEKSEQEESAETTLPVEEEKQETQSNVQRHPGGVITGVTQRPPQSAQ